MSSRGFNGVRSLLIYFALHSNYTLTNKNAAAALKACWGYPVGKIVAIELARCDRTFLTGYNSLKAN